MMEMIFSHNLTWNIASLKYIPRGIYFKILLDDMQQKYTYVKWFFGYGKSVVGFKEEVHLFHGKEKTVLNESDKFTASNIIQSYIIEKHLK